MHETKQPGPAFTVYPPRKPSFWPYLAATLALGAFAVALCLI